MDEVEIERNEKRIRYPKKRIISGTRLNRLEHTILWCLHLDAIDHSAIAKTINLTRHEVQKILVRLESRHLCKMDYEGKAILTRHGIETLYERKDMLHVLLPLVANRTRIIGDTL